MIASGRRTVVRVAFAVLVVVAATLPAAIASAQDAGAGCAAPSWVAAWMMPLSGTNAGYTDRTVRVVAPLTFGGEQVRVRLTNALGNRDATFTNVHVGLAGTGAAVVAGTNARVTFAGADSVTIPAGGVALSDPAPVRVAAFQSVAVSFYAPTATGPGSGHGSTWARIYQATGNHAGEEPATAFGTASSGSRFLNGVDVFAPNDGAIVAFGDSITEGASLREGVEGDFPPYTETLARRLDELARAGGARLAVVNSGISGNRVLKPNTGPSALDRFDRDALEHTGVAGVIMMEGINDLSPLFRQETALPTVEMMATGYRQLAQRAAAGGIQLWISPMTPAGDLKRPTPFLASNSPEQVRLRHDINRWIRAQPDTYDGRIDFDPVVADPEFPNWLTTPYDTGDNLHPNSAGLAAMGASIDLAAFDHLACS